MDDTSLCCDRDGVDEVRNTLSVQLKITNDIDIDEEDEEEDDDFSEEVLLAQMGYAKPDPRKDHYGELEEDEEEEEDSNEAPKHEPINRWVAELNLVSALKGSGEREMKQCRVSWAPDVYDPPCTSDDHFRENKSEQKSTKSRGEGKKSRGGGSSKANEGSLKEKKKKSEKKHKKRGDSGSSSRY